MQSTVKCLRRLSQTTRCRSHWSALYLPAGTSAATSRERRSYSSQAPVDSSNQSDSGFDRDLLRFLCCPISKAPLRWDGAHSELVCDEINVAYPVMEGIPKLVPTDGRVLSDSAS